MLDTETKRRIDTARDILVGKVPDPKSQVEQITIALIYKFMDDMDAESAAMGGKRKFFKGDFARYGWAQLMSPTHGGYEMLALYSEGISKIPENPGIPAFFRDIFKNAYLPYRDPETLKSFLKIINEFHYDHSERLGDAFEYLLSVLGSQGDAGQFRTPRHIIDFIVEILKPQKHETVLDPACGTAGFLISAYKHIARSNTDKKGKSTLTPDEKAMLAQNFLGYDISPDMVRLSLVNLYLHGFTDPHIYEYDTLTSDERWNEFADVIIANPPFMTPKGGITPHKLFSIASKRSEALFLDYIVDHLSPAGRAGVVVPEGIHFVDQSSHTQLRRKLIEANYLLIDITLPHGVFKPYASVKTHILILDRSLARRCESVLFIEIENDGYAQSDTRTPVSGSQLDAALTHITSFTNAILGQEKWSQPDSELRSYRIKKSALLATKSSHLLGRWHDLPNRVIHRGDIPLIRIADLCDIRDGLSPNMATIPGAYVMVVPAEERKTADHWSFEGKAVCIPMVSSAGHGKADIKRLHYQEGQFALANTMCALFVKDEKVLHPKFLHLLLSAMCDELLVPLMCGATNVTMSSSQLADVLIPVPQLTLQEEVVESDLIQSSTAVLIKAALTMREFSADSDLLKLADSVITGVSAYLKSAKSRTEISKFLPSRGV
jgi:N-6 DNA Methylase/Type I restriction modification DNA specificity domain